MVSSKILVNWRRNISFFAARGAAHTLTYGRWRIKQWVWKSAARPYDVDSGELLDSLDRQVIAIGQNAESAFPQLAAHFRTGSTPAFFFGESDTPELVQRIPTEQKEQTVLAAEQICQNVFELRGAGPIKFDGKVDWAYCPEGNIDWRWDLNRHVFFETLGRAYAYTGDERYASKFRELLYDWLENNPARGEHPNWSSVFEVAFRSTMWVWALHYFRCAHTFDADLAQKLLAGLLTHGRYLYDNLELHVPNNHLLLEAKALAFLGIVLPEFKEAGLWRKRGLKLLERQLDEQVCADGVHGERTTLYHRLIAGELLELLVLMENNRVPVSTKLGESFDKMVEFERALAKPDGTFPLLGDSAATDTHMRFSASSGGAVFKPARLASGTSQLNESDYWLLGTRRIEAHAAPPADAAYESIAFPSGGYYLMKAGEGRDARYLVFDCGPFGLPAMPNHGHADALSFELYADGQTLLVDPGLYSTALGQNWRNFFRGTQAHNTLVVDELDQSHLMDVRRVYRPAHATCLSWISNAEYDFVDGVHDGYERLAQPVTHRRQILFAKPDYWVIVDTLTGQGRHLVDLYFHAMPGATMAIDGKSNRALVKRQNGSTANLAIVPFSGANWQPQVVTGETNPIQGWVSFFSGEKVPSPVLRFRQQAQMPVQFITVLYPFRTGQEPTMEVSPLPVEGRVTDDLALTAISVRTRGRLDKIVIDRRVAKQAQVDFSSQRYG